jgi:hypothetical protein
MMNIFWLVWPGWRQEFIFVRNLPVLGMSGPEDFRKDSLAQWIYSLDIFL